MLAALGARSIVSKTLVIDTSSWKKSIQAGQLDYLDERGVRGIFTRASIGLEEDETAARFARAGMERGWVVGMYHFLKPGVNGSQQADAFMDVLADLRYDAAVLDIESPGITQGQVADFLLYWRRNDMPKLGLYTRQGYIDVRNWFVWRHFAYRWMAEWPGSLWAGNWEEKLTDEYATYPFQQFGLLKYKYEGKLRSVGGSIFHGTQAELMRWVR